MFDQNFMEAMSRRNLYMQGTQITTAVPCRENYASDSDKFLRNNSILLGLYSFADKVS